MSARRSFALLLFVPLIGGCFSTQHIPLSAGSGLDEATGVVTRSGTRIDFSVTGATIRNDTLHANGIHDVVAIPIDSISQLSVRNFSGRNTAGLVVGVGAVAFAVLAIFSIGNLANIR